MSTILTGNTLAAGLVSTFQGTYEQTYKGVLQDLGNVMQLDVPATTRTVTYAAHETMPYPERRELADPIAEESTGAIQFSVTNHEYSKRIAWRRRDRTDNQIGDLFGKAASLGGNFASLDSRVLFEFITGTAELVPSIPNAPDGVGPYSATDGDGADRFGFSGGNTFTKAGTTAANITADFHKAIGVFEQFQNTKGEPFFESSSTGVTYTIYAPSDLRENFIGAFKAELIQGSSAAPSNTIIASGENIRLVFTSRLAGTADWVIFRDDAPVKPFFSQLRQPLRSVTATEENSDRARTDGVESVQFATEKGYGINIPFGTIKIT